MIFLLMSKMTEIDFTNYKQTPVIKSMTKSKSIENLQLTDTKPKAETK